MCLTHIALCESSLFIIIYLKFSTRFVLDKRRNNGFVNSSLMLQKCILFKVVLLSVLRVIGSSLLIVQTITGRLLVFLY